MAEEIEVAGLVTKIAIDDTLINKSMAELDRKMKLVKSEFDKASSGLKDFSKSTESLSVKSDSLGKMIDVQAARVAKLNEQHKKAVEEKGADAVATQKLEVQLNKAVAEYNKLDAELKSTTVELSKQEKEAQIAASSWTKLATTLNAAGDKMQVVGKQMESAGKSATKYITAPLVAVSALSVKAAIDFESAFAGVRKTVDATEAEFAALSTGIRKMATEDVPVAATEIAKVAEAAGQLGIQKSAIMGFTRTMVDLGVATNLTGDQAATALARLANITQMPQENFDRLGSTIVELGNNLATTESEIVEMSLRLAGAGKTIGLTEAQILSFAGSLSSVGIEAEAGGSAFSKLWVSLASETATGGKKLEGFAAVANMSAAEFQKAFKEDATGAIISFVEGLGKMQKTGGNVFGVLEDLGISEVRMRDALLRASNAGDLFRESIELGSKAWQENTALTKEAEQRYETTASKFQMLKNRVTDVGITLGDVLIPAMMDGLKAAEPLFKMIERGAIAFSNMDEGTQKTIVTMAALAAVAGPALIVTGKMVTSLGAITKVAATASTSMAAAGGGAAVLSRGLMLLMGPIGWVIGGITALTIAGIALNKHLSKDSIPAVQDFGEQASSAAQRASGSFSKFRQSTQSDLKETAATAKVEGEKIGKGIATGVGNGTKEAKKQAVDDMKEMIDNMKETVDRNTSSLSKLGDGITNALKKQYDEMEKVQTKALDKQVDEERKASDQRLKIYDKEYNDKLKLVDAEAYKQIKAIQDQIDAVDAQTDAEDKARREQEYRDRIAEYNKQLSLATTAEEREKIQKDITKTITDYERQLLIETRKIQKEGLKSQIDAVKESTVEKKEALKLELEDQKLAEKDKLEVTLQGLSDEKDAIKTHYAGLTTAESLQAEARKLVVEKNNDEIVRLLESYNPKWQDAGQSLADSFSKGLSSENQAMTDAITDALNIAPVIDKQVIELDRMQVKLKELEETAKASSGSGGFDFGFDDAAEEAEELADILNNELQPGIEGVSEAAKEVALESLKAFIGLNSNVTEELYRLKWSGDKVTEETATSIADKFFAMGDTILGNLEASHADRLESMRQFFKDSSSLTEKEEEDALKKLQESMKGEAAEIKQAQKRVAEIFSTALNERRGLREDEYAELLRIQKELFTDAETALGGHETEQKIILERMKADAEAITARQAAEVVKLSKAQRDEVIKASEEQYDKSIAEIIKMRDESKIISSEQADALIADAKRQRDESVVHAEQMHKDVIREAKALAKGFVDNIDWATGEVLTGWDLFKSDFHDKMVQSKIDFGKWAYDAFKEIYDKGYEMGEKLRKIDLKSIGNNIIQGLIDGLSEKLELLKSKASEIGNAIKDKVGDVLQIRSPSRVMMQLGEHTGEGLSLGLQSKLIDIRRQAAAMAQAAIPGMQSLSLPSSSITTGTRSSGSESIANTYSFEGMFAGANFNVRTDNDIRALAKELGDYILTKGRG